ncbi:MAG: outer membrane lipoprotein-sorting protein [Halioglobus sp.]
MQAPRMYRFFLSLTFIYCALSLANPVHAIDKNEHENTDGTPLASKVYDRLAAVDATTRAQMVLYNDNVESRRRTFYSYAKDKGMSERWTLLRFVEPNDIAGTGLLTLDYKGDNSTQWLYLPALDRVRRISSSRKGGHFVGSDFYYEDLMDREVDMDRHKLLGSEVIDEIQCQRLESVPVDPSNSVYSKRVSWINPETLVPLRVDFFKENKLTPVKRLTAKKIELIQDHWTVFESTMENLESGSYTQLITSQIVYDQGLPDELFTQRALEDDRREAQFRP